MIECMCVVCHGPIGPRANTWQAVTCHQNCRKAWRTIRHGANLGKFDQLRTLHAWRREQQAILMWVAERVPAALAFVG